MDDKIAVIEIGLPEGAEKPYDIKKDEEAASQELSLTTPEGAKALLSKSKTSQDWNDNTDKIKSANGGYPDWWFPEIIMSGFASALTARF